MKYANEFRFLLWVVFGNTTHLIAKMDGEIDWLEGIVLLVSLALIAYTGFRWGLGK